MEAWSVMADRRNSDPGGPSLETEKMRKIFVAALVLLGGCQNIIGPFTARQPMRIDDPRLTIGEQQQPNPFVCRS